MDIVDIKKFRDNAIADNLCSEYTEKWNNDLSRKRLIDMALDTKGADYLCDSISKGWGVSPEYIYDKFNPFINGRYTAKLEGYDSKMFCNYDGNVISDTTILILINTKVKVELPKYNISEIYCTGKCNIDVIGDGEAVFVCYGNENDIIINNPMNSHIKRIQKKEKDRY